MGNYVSKQKKNEWRAKRRWSYMALTRLLQRLDIRVHFPYEGEDIA